MYIQQITQLDETNRRNTRVNRSHETLLKLEGKNVSRIETRFKVVFQSQLVRKFSPGRTFVYISVNRTVFIEHGVR